MITDFRSADHTMIDPQSDAVQIVGRFRNGVSGITVITNQNDALESSTAEEIDRDIKNCEECYRTIEALAEAVKDNTSKNAIREALSHIRYAAYLHEDGTTNHFMIDNFKHNELVKSYYANNNASLRTAYNNEQTTSQYFTVSEITDEHEKKDTETPIFDDLPKYKDKVASIVKYIATHESKADSMFTLGDDGQIKNQLRRYFPEIIEGYELLGAEELLKIGYTKKDIQKAIKLKKNETEPSNYQLITDLHEYFQDGRMYKETEIRQHFRELIKRHQLSIHPTIKNFEKYYFQIGPRTSCPNDSTKKCRKIIKAKHARKTD